MFKKLYIRLSSYFTSFRLILLSFLLIILLGTLLLSLPVSSAEGVWTSPQDALFTAASASCVTGLIVHNTATYWSLFGKTVILLLIQIGGLGVITCTLAVIILSGKKIGIRERSVLQDAISAPQIGGIIRFTHFILMTTLTAECAGAMILMISFIPRFGFGKGICYAVFHSVSAFCNAGFDLMGEEVPFISLSGFRSDVIVSTAICLLIVAGGLGFLTWNDLINNRFRFRQCSFQTKIILMSTLWLILLPFLYFFLHEFSGEPVRERILMSLFQAVTPRTAGFNTADYGSMSDTGLLISAVLMLCGGAPGSTAGGMKITTVFVLIISAVSSMRRKDQVLAFGRSFSEETIRNAGCLLMVYLVLLVTGCCLISSLEDLPMSSALFECASALGTVGLTTGITPDLCTASKILLVSFMYFGRVGGLTLAYAALSRRPKINVRYPAGKVMIG